GIQWAHMKKNKTAGLNLRMSPRCKFNLELLSRKQRRSISSVIEDMATAAMNSTMPGIAEKLWAPDDAGRVINMAIHSPDLLTHDEELIVNTIIHEPLLWDADFGALVDRRIEEERDFAPWEIAFRGGLLDMRLVRLHWPTIVSVAEQERYPGELTDEILKADKSDVLDGADAPPFP
ncbi:MAG: hypothetical protein RLZ25_1, partial [Pseudomonadota bacterium]